MRAEQGENVVVFIDDGFILKIYSPDKKGFVRERRALNLVADRISIPIPRVVAEGEFESLDYLITERISGRSMRRDEWLTLDRSVQFGLVIELAKGLQDLHKIDNAESIFVWDKFVTSQVETVIERQRKEGGNPEWLESLPSYLEKHLPLLPMNGQNSFMHGDVHFGNLRLSNDLSRPLITGLFDFADSFSGFHEYEFVAIGVLMIQGQGELQRELFRAYGYHDSEIDVELRRRLMLLTILYEHSSLRRYAERLGPGSEKLSLEELERAIWNFA